MSTQGRLAELKQRHQALEDQIAEELNHPSSDDLRIAELKRQKLKLKDEIARLEGQSGAAA